MKFSARLCLILVLLQALPAAATVETELLHADPGHYAMRLRLTDNGLTSTSIDGKDYDRLEQEGLREALAPGDPALLSHTFVLEIPATSDVTCRYNYSRTVVHEIDLPPISEEIEAPFGETTAPNPAVFCTDAFYPAEIVQISDPAVLRNHRLVQVAVTPYQYNPVTRELRVYHDLELDFRFEGINEINQVTRELPPSATFEHFLAGSVLNYEQMQPQQRDWDTNLGLEPILYIFDTGAEDYLRPWLDWKQQQGHVVYEATEEDMTLTYSSQVKNYIQTAYDTWDNPPVFVVLVGDPSYCSFGRVAASNSTGDHYYSQLDGSDILGDVFVGRMSVASASQLQNVVNKQLSYERNPFPGDNGWFDRAHLVGDNSYSGMSCVYVNENIRHKLEEAGFNDVTSCYHYLGCTNEVNSIRNAINGGILYFNYRGYWGMSGWDNYDANQLTNGYMLPFVVTITCGTGDFVNNTGLSEGFYQAGTASTPRGAIAAIGTATTGTHTRYNNVVDVGIYGGIFDHQQRTAGEALFQGKFDLWLAYQGIASYHVNNFSHWNNLMGDASLALRTALPTEITVGCAGTVPAGATALPVTVLADNIPLPDALVTLCRLGEEGFQISARTDEAGQVVLPLAGTYTAGEATLTVSGLNIYPVQQDVQLVSEDVYVDIAGWELDDDAEGESSGNNDGQLNPGETIELMLALGNLGTAETATGISVALASSDIRCELLQGEATGPDLTPGEQGDLSLPLLFDFDGLIDPELPPHLSVQLEIATDQGAFLAALQLPVTEPLLQVDVVDADPQGDGTIDLEEACELNLELRNIGNSEFPFCVAELVCTDDWLEVLTGSSAYELIGIDGVGGNLTPFEVQPVAGCFNGQLIPVRLTLSAYNGYTQVLDYELKVGRVLAEDPLGPVAGLYYCFDSDDVFYSQHPVFSWMELSEIVDVDEALDLTDYYNEDDDSEAIELPFDFVYWDQSYTEITVCSNGWIAMGNQEDQVNYRNFPIPTGIGPGAMIAPFWDDLRTTSGSNPDGKVFPYYDETNHRFIIEWYDLTQVGPGSPSETFQVILYDQDYFGTPNGDILFQYLEVTNNTNSSTTDNNYATVGIESPDQVQGLEYSYWNDYPMGATILRNELAILFTQERGEYSQTDSWEPVITHLPLPYQTGDGPYAIEAQIVDDSGIAYANLHWSTDEENYTAVTMVNSEDDTWTAEIPGQTIGTRVWYYIEAVDASEEANQATTQVYTFIIGEWQEQYADDMEQGEGDWTHSAPEGWIDQWHLSDQDQTSGSYSWKCGDPEGGDYAECMDSRLLLTPFEVAPEARLRFWHRIEAEDSYNHADSCYDGGVVEISVAGDPWQVLPALTGGYNKYFRWTNGYGQPATHPFPGGTPCFSGEFDWQESTFLLHDYAGQSIEIRFRFGSDEGTEQEGWYIDDLVIENFFPPEAAGEEPGVALPRSCQLAQNYPNPFNPTTTIEYAIPQAGPVRLQVYNLRGQQVLTLVDAARPAGRHAVVLDASRLASGLYFYSLTVGEFRDTKKMMLVK